MLEVNQAFLWQLEQMNYKKLLLIIVGIFCGGVELQLVCAEKNRAIVVQQPTFKSLERIPWSLDKFNEQKNNLSAEKIKKIRERLNHTSNEKVSLLFDMATLLPKEIQRKIVTNVCYDPEDLYTDTKKLVDQYFAIPIGEWSWSYQVFRGDIFPDLKKGCGQSSHWTPKIIAENAQDIVVYKSWCNDMKQCCDRKMLESINKFAGVFLQQRIYWGDVKYSFRETYTINNFMKHQKSEYQWYLLPILLAPFVAKSIGQGIYPDLSAGDIAKIAMNQAIQVEHDSFVREKFEQTKNALWLSFLETKIPGVDQCQQNLFDDRNSLHVWSWIIPSLGAGLGAPYRLWRNDSPNDRKYKGFYLFVGVVSGFGTFVATAAANGLFMVLDSCINIERPIPAIACVTGLYVAAVSLWNVMKMRTVREETVKINALSELLQCRDIEIV